MSPLRYIRFKVIRTKNLKRLFASLDSETKPYELVVHGAIGNTRPITIKSSTQADANYFARMLNDLEHDAYYTQL